MTEIRKATASDYDDTWEIIRQVVSTGDTYVFDPNSFKRKNAGILVCPGQSYLCSFNKW